MSNDERMYSIDHFIIMGVKSTSNLSIDKIERNQIKPVYLEIYPLNSDTVEPYLQNFELVIFIF